MHDFLLAKEITDELLRIAAEKKLEKIKSVNIEIGSVALAHDGFDEHTEDIDLENLEFGLQSIIKNTILADAKFNIKKTSGENWKIIGIEV